MAGSSQRPRPSERARPGGARSPVARLRLPRRVRVGGRFLFGASAALVLAAAGTGFFFERAVVGSLTTSNALAGLGTRAEADQNILLMGLDSRKDMNGQDLPASILGKLHAGSSSDIGGYNTNTLILLHVPADGSRATALSIPRDDYVDLPDHLGRHKIKEAYGRAKAVAEDKAHDAGVTDPAQLERLGREAGRQAAIQAVQDLLGVQVDHFAEINLAGFYDLADALGGVTVCLRHPAHDDYSGANFPAGVQTLDGRQALAFVRQRHNLAGGDLDRTHRQQAFLASAVAKLDSAGVFGDLGRLGALLDVAHRDVVVDAGFDPLTFLRRAGSVTSGDVRFYTLPIQRFATVDGASVNLVDPAQVRAVTRSLLSGHDAGTGGPQIPQVAGSGAGPQSPAARSVPTATHVPPATGTPSAAGQQSATAAPPASPAPSTSVAAPSHAAVADLTPPPGVPCVD